MLAPLCRMGGTVLPGLFKGATIVVTPELNPVETLALIERHRVTVLLKGPLLFRILLEALGDREADLASLRFCICGGDTVLKSLIWAWPRSGCSVSARVRAHRSSPAG